MKRKKKNIIDKKKSDQKKAFRIPTAPPTKAMKDKKKYNRKDKHKMKKYEKYLGEANKSKQMEAGTRRLTQDLEEAIIDFIAEWNDAPDYFEDIQKPGLMKMIETAVKNVNARKIANSSVKILGF